MSSITGTAATTGVLGTNTGIAASPTAYASGVGLAPAVQTIWSKEILFQAMPVLRFEQFAVKKTELGVAPGLTINFMRYDNLAVDEDDGAALLEGIRMVPTSLSASQYQITVSEQGRAVATSELLLNASFDDVMASASRLLGRHMAQSMDVQARNTLYTATSVLFGREIDISSGTGAFRTRWSPYDPGDTTSTPSDLDAPGAAFWLAPATVKDGVETLASRNVPRLGETYVCFVHPHQSRKLRDWPEWMEVSKYAAPGNFMLGEIGRINDVVFIETTQVRKTLGDGTVDPTPANNTVYNAVMIGDNAFGHAVSLPVELRDGGVLDFGREHALAWYAIWGFGLITDISVVSLRTN